MTQQISIDDKRLSFVSLSEATTPPPGLIEHIKDRYWVSHPEKGILFWDGKFAQCNGSKEIVERISQMYPWAQVIFVPSVFRKIDPSDYV